MIRSLAFYTPWKYKKTSGFLFSGGIGESLHSIFRVITMRHGKLLGLDFLKVGTFGNWLKKDLLTLAWQRFLSYRNQSINLQSISWDWFLYDRDLRHESVKSSIKRKNMISLRISLFDQKMQIKMFTAIRSYCNRQNCILFQFNVPTIYPLKISENLWKSDVFRGYRKRKLAWNG